MSTKTSTLCPATVCKDIENYQQAFKKHDAEHKCVTAGCSKEVVLISEGTVVEVTVKREEKTKQQKYTPTKTSSNGVERKTIIEKKKSVTNSSETQQNWGRTFGEQILLYAKQAPSLTVDKYYNNKKMKKNVDVQKQQKNRYTHEHKVTVSSKKMPSQKKPQENSKLLNCNGNSLSSTSMNSIPSVLVIDRAVQCSGICDSSNRFDEFNPVRTLEFLIKELKGSIKKDKRTNEIFSEMEQMLCRIPVDTTKSICEDLEAITVRSRLETSTVQLKESSKKMKAMCESWVSEREMLQSQIHKQAESLKEANQKQMDLESRTKLLAQQLREITQAGQVKEEMISALKQQMKNDKFSEKIISDLKAELVTQTELARSKHVEIQYLKMEIDKLSVLCSYKDTLITESRNTIKELQNHIAKQWTDKVYDKVNEGNGNSKISKHHAALVCSSPNSSSSNRSNNPISWQDLSDTSFSAIESERYLNLKEDAIVKDSAHLEFVSLPGGESSYILNPDSYKSQITAINVDKEAQHNNTNNTVPYRHTNIDDTTAKRNLHYSSKKDYNKENVTSKAKFSKSKRGQSDSAKNLFHHNRSNILKNVASNKSTIPDAKAYIQQTLDDMQNRISINVPSPVRDYPHPDWSDSSLPSISTASELDIVPSNDI